MTKKYVLHIETSSPYCSVSLSENETHLETIEGKQINSHATQLTNFIQSICNNNSKKIQDLSALSFSSGPGSYTGLRIGLSVLKGISYLNETPIVFVNTLDAIASAMIEEFKGEEYLFCPMIDARRKEVYVSTYNCKNQRQSEYSSIILDGEIDLKEIYRNKRLVLGGDGTKHTQNNVYYKEITHSTIVKLSSRFLISKAMLKITNNEYENNLYCQPFYLKKPFLNIKKQ